MRVVVGVGGGIAAYKAADIVSQLVQAKCDVRVVMTPSATKFVAPLTFAALTQQKVITSLFPDTSSGGMDVIYPHLYPATEADAFAVIPATANAIGKLATGLGDDMVSCSALSLKQGCKRIYCPAIVASIFARSLRAAFAAFAPAFFRCRCRRRRRRARRCLEQLCVRSNDCIRLRP